MLDAESARIAAAGRRFLSLFALNDAASIAACYTDDAEILASNRGPIRGRAAIESLFKFTNRPGHSLDFETAELDIHGGTAIEIGTYLRRLEDGSTFDRGRYIVIWKRIDDEWKIHRDMFTSQPRPSVGLQP
ncbi:MAG TPA: nuclear transport factor 2 family protein [Burkholderiales bacterium]|jgi:ketosteroid isomerase-like protein|nr:nuclear transport factor 2 family protein [Burkholderiales bacterium]